MLQITIRRFALVAMLLLSAALSHAQSPFGPPPQKFKGYRADADTAFPIGVHGGLAHVDYLRQSLHIDYTQTYGSEWNLKYYDTTNPTSLSSTDLDTRNFYRDAVTYGLGVVTSPGAIANLASDLFCRENYYGWDPDHNDGIGWMIPTAWPDTNDPSRIRSNNTFFFGRRFDSNASHQPLVMVSGPKQTLIGMHPSNPEWFQRLGQPDSTDYYDVVLTLKADQTALTSPLRHIDDTTTIAYAIIYKRDTTGQNGANTCRCNIYVPIGRLSISKAMYLSRSGFAVDSVFGSRDFVYTFKLKDTVRTISPDLTIPKWHDTTHTQLIYHSGTQIHRWDTAIGHGQVFPRGDHGADPTDSCRWYCSRLLKALEDRGLVPTSPDSTINRDLAVDYSDLTVDVYTTRVVDITFLKATIGNHVISMIRDGRLDPIVKASIDSAMLDKITTGRFAALDTVLWRYGTLDEPEATKYYAYRYLASKMQRYIRARDTNDKRGLWSDPISAQGQFRIYSGDLDSTEYKQIHMASDQIYTIGGTIPVKYARIDSMVPRTNSFYYRLSALDYVHDTLVGAVTRHDTIRTRFIMGNSAPDYECYTRNIQGGLLSKSSSLLSAIDISRHRFSAFNVPPYAVYMTCQVHGYLNSLEGFFSGWRPTTPEEITVQPWLAISCGVDGLLFSDFQFKAGEFGVMHGSRDSAVSAHFWNNEYDSLYSGDPRDIGFPDRGLPKMWLGFRSRLAAVKAITDTLYDRILPAYRKLDRNPWRITMSDTATSHNGSNGHVSGVPMIDTVLAEKAVAHTPTFTASGQFDTRPQTFMDVSVFQPGQYLKEDIRQNARYLVCVNRRTWPIDFTVYPTTIKHVLDSFSVVDYGLGYRHSDTGLGNIDVRRPVIVFTNSLNFMADSILIVRMSDTTQRRVVPFGSRVNLDWLAPGWGEMYRITPVTRGVSPYGTAYNNGVRSEEPSDDATQSAQMLVYERDSVVYLRTVDSLGVWSSEYRISDSVDALFTGSGPRKANNIFPVVATARNLRVGIRSTLVIWERDSAGIHSVEGRMINGAPTAAKLASSIRFRIASGRSVSSGRNLTPALVGIDSGYIAAWGSVTSGIEYVAIRNFPSPNPAKDISTVASVKATTIPIGTTTYPVDSLSLFPTLAYVSNYGVTPETPSQSYHSVHLAWQQAGPWGSGTYQILYKRIGAYFPPTPTRPVLHTAAPIEYVTANLPGCSFTHPSIAADTARIGVAFESNVAWAFTGKPLSAAPYNSVATLRFWTNQRKGKFTPSVWVWSSPAYCFVSNSSWNVFPSLTEFPSMYKDSLLARPDGGLAWFEGSDNANGRRGEWIYRYGWYAPQFLDFGEYPTMTLVPYRRNGTPFSSTSVFFRDDTTRMALPRTPLGTGTYYQGLIENRRPTPLAIFSGTPPDKLIHASMTLTNIDPLGLCALRIVSGGLILPHSAWDTMSFPTNINPAVPDIPPSFFHASEDTAIVTGTLDEASGVARTSVFKAGFGSVTVRRLVSTSEKVSTWLDASPYDSTLGMAADVQFYLELVRAADSLVLWRGDTVSARFVGDNNSLDDDVSVPVSVAPSGTEVFVRMRSMTTAGMSYDVASAFEFLPDSIANSNLNKRSWRAWQISSAARPGGAARIWVVPNPARSSAEIHLRTAASGPAGGAVYDMLGKLVRQLPDIDLKEDGEYSIPVDLSEFRDGIYTIRVNAGGSWMTARLVVTK